jgi:hypothetical protein
LLGAAGPIERMTCDQNSGVPRGDGSGRDFSSGRSGVGRGVVLIAPQLAIRLMVPARARWHRAEYPFATIIRRQAAYVAHGPAVFHVRIIGGIGDGPTPPGPMLATFTQQKITGRVRPGQHLSRALTRALAPAHASQQMPRLGPSLPCHGTARNLFWTVDPEIPASAEVLPGRQLFRSE